MRWVDPDDGAPRRHARVWLDPAVSHAATSDAATAGVIDGWVAKARPVVARRADPGSPRSCAVAIALPLAAGRRRIAFTVEPAAIVRIEPPLALAEVRSAAPPGWRPALALLAERGLRIGIEFRVYGSLAWQAITGEPCVRPGSDVDLLWSAGDDARIGRGIDLLDRWEAETGLRADGEFLMPNGDGIAWREIASGASRVLVKGRNRVSLRPSPWRRDDAPANDAVRTP